MTFDLDFIMERIGKRFEEQKKHGLEIMGSVEELYLQQCLDTYCGTEIKKFRVGDVCHFMFIRSCVQDGEYDGYKRYRGGLIGGDGFIYMSEAIYLNYCKLNNHVPQAYKVLLIK